MKEELYIHIHIFNRVVAFFLAQDCFLTHLLEVDFGKLILLLNINFVHVPRITIHQKL